MTEIYHGEDYEVSLVTCSHNATIFNRTDFLHHQQETFKCNSLIFEFSSIKYKKKLASIDFSCRENEFEWFTPITGAFSNCTGLFSLTFSELELFVKVTSQFLFKEKSALKITWKTPPLYFNSIFNHKLHNVLFRLGWVISTSDLNFHLPVSDYITFRSNLAGSKRKELNKISRTQTSFEFANDADSMRNIYEVIKENRMSQGYPITMSLEALLALKKVIQDDLIFAALKRNNEILAGAIIMNIDHSTSYVFYWGERPCFRHESPIIKVCEHIYLYALAQKKEYIDIGISTVNSMPNEGLVNFKISMGCQVSQKQTFVLSTQANL